MYVKLRQKNLPLCPAEAADATAVADTTRNTITTVMTADARASPADAAAVTKQSKDPTTDTYSLKNEVSVVSISQKHME